MPPTVTVAVAANFSLPFSFPCAKAWRTAFSISRWALTPNILRNLRMLALKISSFMIASFAPLYAARKKSGGRRDQERESHGGKRRCREGLVALVLVTALSKLGRSAATCAHPWASADVDAWPVPPARDRAQRGS